MKRIALWVLLILSTGSIVHAGQNVIYENDFFRGYSQPYDQVDEFLGAGESAKITVINGDMEDDAVSKTSSSIVKINGKIILDSSNFNQKVDSIERIIDLEEGPNILSANLKGKPGGKITIKIEQETSTAGVIDSTTGGTIEVEDPESAISGAKVEIPPEAADEDVEIVIAATEMPAPLPDELIPAGENVNIISNIEDEFSEPVYLGIPYNDKNNDGVLDGTTISEIRVGVKNFNGSNWEEVEVIDRDLLANVVIIETTHFSNYIAYAGPQRDYTFTQKVQDGTIIVDGDGSDWLSLTPEPIDLEGDISKGDSTWDIKHVYTAIDNQYAYLMVETYGGAIPVDATIEIYVNHKVGESFTWQPYADFGMNHHPDFSSFWNYAGALDIQGYEVNRGSVLEVKIPLSEIDNATYFNAIFLKIWKDNWADVYDEFTFGPHMDYWMAERHYYDGSSLTRLQFEFYDDNNNFVNENINPQSIILENIDDQTTYNLTSDYTWEPWFLLFGRWIEYPIPDWYFNSDFTSGGSYYVDLDSLAAGNYRLTVEDPLGNQYQRDFYFKGSFNLLVAYPSVADDNLFFDSAGNLHAYWNSPFSDDPNDQIKFYPMQDDGEPDFSAIWVTTRLDRGYAMVPASTLQKLYAKDGGGRPYAVGFQIRSGDRSNRWYAEKVSISSIPEGIPLKWQQPIIEDWTDQGGFNPIRWYPYYFQPNVKVTPDIDSVTIETTEDDRGQALYISKYEIESDFDIQIDYQLDNWPQTAGKRDVQLTFQFGYGYNDLPGAVIGITPSGGFLYDGTPTTAPRVYFCDPGLIDVPTHDTSGKFRIERVGSIINAYFWDTQSDDWILLNTLNDIGPQPIVMSVHNWGWGGNPGGLVTGTFSKFQRIK